MPFRIVGYNKPIDDSSLGGMKQSVLDLVQWVTYELQQVSSTMEATEPDQVWNSAPPKPRRGTYAYADGTNWNPSTGEGPYYFDGNNWIPMSDRPSGYNGSFELGSLITPNTPFIDFHSSGYNNDFDSRIIASGGSSTNGAGNLNIEGGGCVCYCTFLTNNGCIAQGPNVALAFTIQNTTYNYSKYFRVNSGAQLEIINNANSAVIGTFDDVGRLAINSGYGCRQGIGGAAGSNTFNTYWVGGTGLQVWVDSTNLGYMNVTSDYRIKKDVQDAPRAMSEVLQWRVVTYTGADWGIFEANDNTKTGFIAHELQAVSPDCVNGEKDGEHPQSLELVPIVAKLTKAVQELEARVKRLERGQ